MAEVAQDGLGVLSSLRSRPRMNNGISAGTTVTEMIATPISAKLLVNASG